MQKHSARAVTSYQFNRAYIFYKTGEREKAKPLFLSVSQNGGKLFIASRAAELYNELNGQEGSAE